MKDEQGDPDVDVVLTIRAIVRMLRGEQINPAVLPETPFDRFFKLHRSILYPISSLYLIFTWDILRWHLLWIIFPLSH